MNRILLIFSVLFISVSAMGARHTVGFDSYDIGHVFTMSGNPGGVAKITANPAGQGRVIRVKHSDWAQICTIHIDLPQGITLGDCKSVSVDYFVTSGEGNDGNAKWKQALLEIDGKQVFKDTDDSGADTYPDLGDLNAWHSKTLSIGLLKNAPLNAGSFDLGFAFNDDKMVYYIGGVTFAYDLNRPAPVLPEAGAWTTGRYRNLFAEAGYTAAQIDKRTQQLWDTYFKGDKDSERLYYEVGADMAYILDVNNGDVRSEGMSYGMMICLQLDRKQEFDALWKWAKTYMQHPDSEKERHGYFAWQCATDGSRKDGNSAPDGEEYFITALMMASNRWGDGQGIYNYSKEANNILNVAIHRPKEPAWSDSFALFDSGEKQVVFVPYGQAASFTDPSYHLPAFYELWAKWADNDRDFCAALAAKSRQMWPKFAHAETGLMPDYAEFGGNPYMGHGDHGGFAFDAWRCAMNMAVDYSWFKPQGVDYCELLGRQQRFFIGKGIDSYHNQFEVGGKEKQYYGGATDHSPGLVACNASGALASDSRDAWLFVDNFYDAAIPTGKYRYYDGMLYFLNWLICSGQYRIYAPGGQSAIDTLNAPADTPALSLEGNVIVSSADTFVTIYSLPAGIVMRSLDIKAGQCIDISDLPRGLYAAKADSAILKFRN